MVSDRGVGGKAKKVLDDAYQKKEQAEKQALDELVNVHHGSWERLKNMKTCWYQQLWGTPEGTVIHHDFKAFLSEVVLKSRVEEDKSPLRAPKRRILVTGFPRSYLHSGRYQKGSRELEESEFTSWDL